MNIEKFELLETAPLLKLVNPKCTCGKRMKSAGKGKGYKCPSCGLKLRNGTKETTEVLRNIREGFYETPPSARRHLSKPIVRN